jgi:glycosyltransferase involved in cell wall biosynthesis
MKNKKVLFIPETYPSGLTGTSVKTRRTIEFLLKSGVSVDVACMNFDTLAKKDLKHRNLRIFNVYSSGIRKLRLGLFVKLFRYIFSIKPIIVHRIYDKRLEIVINTLLDSFEYDYVFFDGFSTMQYANQMSKSYIYIDNEDITILLKKRFLESNNIFRKIFMYSEYLRSKLFEKKYFKLMGQVWAISKNGLKRFKTISKGKHVLMPTIVPEENNVYNKNSKNIVFTGTLSWPENYIGLRWFLESCWDDILKVYPETKLLIIGQRGDNRLNDILDKSKNVELLGYVEKLSDVYKNCSLAISPVFINVGIKIKVLTYLSFGLPVVATKQSLGGMVSKDGVLASNKSNFSKAIIKLLKDDKMRNKLSLAGYNNIKKNHLEFSLDQFFKKNSVL